MLMIVIVIVIVRVRVAVMLVEHLLRERVILGERRIVPVTMSAAVRAGFGLERRARALDRRAEPREHVGEHGIVFELQAAGADFNRRMAVAEVIRGARERERV